MKKLHRISLILLFVLIGNYSGFGQALTLVSSVDFEGPADMIDGNSSTYAVTCSDENCSGIAIAVFRANSINYIKTLTIDIWDLFYRNISIGVYCMNKYGYFEYKYIRNITADEGVYYLTLDVNEYSNQIIISSDAPGFAYISEISVTGEFRYMNYTYNAAGLRTARTIVSTSTKSATDTTNSQQQEYALDNGNNSSIILFPNPTSGILNFELKNSDKEKGTQVLIKVYTLNGVLMREETFDMNSFTIDLTGEQNGMYLLDMKINGMEKNFTVIKNE